MPTRDDDNGLERSMTLRGLVFYGTGTILGAGIFVVIGEVVGEAGALSPLSYALAGLVAVFTALSFAELGARIPSAGGPIDYVERAFGRRWLAIVVGWTLVIANVVSGATITTGFVSYLSSFVDVPNWIGVVGLVAVLGAISVAGMKQSAWFMTVTTLLGIVTLLAILWATRDSLMAAPGRIAGAVGSFDGSSAGGLFTGAFLAIYSFIGFGDMAQTAEETKDVQKTLPRAIVIALIIVFAFYILVSAALVGGPDMDGIAGADAPLVRAAANEGWPELPLAIASLFVIVNGGLSQVIAASRLLLDLGRDEGGAPRWLGRVNDKTNTPVIATLLTVAVILALALFVPLKNLASGTSLAILLVFCGVNAALFQLKRQGQPEGVPNVWRAVPILGFGFCALAIVGQIVIWTIG